MFARLSIYENVDLELTERVSLDEVTDVYLPLSRLLNLNVGWSF